MNSELKNMGWEKYGDTNIDSAMGVLRKMIIELESVIDEDSCIWLQSIADLAEAQFGAIQMALLVSKYEGIPRTEELQYNCYEAVQDALLSVKKRKNIKVLDGGIK